MPYSEVLHKDPHLQPSAAASLLFRECMTDFPMLHYGCVRKRFAQENEIDRFPLNSQIGRVMDIWDKRLWVQLHF